MSSHWGYLISLVLAFGLNAAWAASSPTAPYLEEGQTYILWLDFRFEANLVVLFLALFLTPRNDRTWMISILVFAMWLGGSLGLYLLNRRKDRQCKS